MTNLKRKQQKYHIPKSGILIPKTTVFNTFQREDEIMLLKLSIFFIRLLPQYLNAGFQVVNESDDFLNQLLPNKH